MVMQYFSNVMFNFQDSIEAFNGHACYDNSMGNMIIHFRPLQRFLSEKCFHPRLSDFAVHNNMVVPCICLTILQYSNFSPLFIRS